ncbi:MAG: L,D-transpeptidase family protein [Anderseniella sp.]
MALIAGAFSCGGLPVEDAAAESIERNYYPRARSEQPANTGIDSNGERAATTLNSATNWFRSSPPSAKVQDTLSSRTQIYSSNRSVAPMLNTRSAPALEYAIQLYEKVARGGGWGRISASKSLRRGGKGRAVVAVRRRLAIEGYLPRDAAQGQEYDDVVAQAVAGYQQNNGLSVTGRVDKATAAAMSVPARARLETMRANLIRLPEYTKDLGSRYVLVNIPAAKLEAVDGSRVVSSHAVIVGKLERPSPIVTSEISEINFNPYWHSPKSIVIKDIVPKVRKSRSILKKMQIKIFDGYRGPEVDPRSIDWNAPAEEIADKYHFRQEPGGENAMASVKINFRNKFSVYMHDTPTKTLFQENQRYFSSGCVRVEDVHQLTSWVLGNQDGWNLRQIKSVARSEDRVDVALKGKVSVHWVYLTAWAGPDGMVRFRDDIYELDGTGFITGQPIGSTEGSAG